MNKKTKEILLILAVFILIVIVGMLILFQMSERITNDCEKQNFEGMLHYWDVSVDCSYFEQEEIIEEYNTSLTKFVSPVPIILLVSAILLILGILIKNILNEIDEEEIKK